MIAVCWSAACGCGPACRGGASACSHRRLPALHALLPTGRLDDLRGRPGRAAGPVRPQRRSWLQGAGRPCGRAREPPSSLCHTLCPCLFRLRSIFTLAKERDLDLDFHTDENGNEPAKCLRYVAQKAIEHGYQNRVVCGHAWCAPLAGRLAGRLAGEAGVPCWQLDAPRAGRHVPPVPVSSSPPPPPLPNAHAPQLAGLPGA